MFGFDKDLDFCFFKVFLCHVLYVKEFDSPPPNENSSQNTGVPKEREGKMIYFLFSQKKVLMHKEINFTCCSY